MVSQRVSLLVDGIALAGELFPAPNEVAPAVVLCHGIPAGAPDPADPGYPGLARRLWAEGFSVFIFNFRGCGLSEGNLDLAGWRRDLKTALDFLAQAIDFSKLFLLGFSAGAAVSVPIAAGDSRVSGLALVACPASFDHLLREEEARSLLEQCRRVGSIREPGFPPSLSEWATGFLEVSPVEWIGRLSPRPVLIVHGEADELVPVDNARQLYERAGELKELVVLPGLGHRLRREEKAVAVTIQWLKTQAGKEQQWQKEQP